jgi:hypothetical protein
MLPFDPLRAINPDFSPRRTRKSSGKDRTEIKRRRQQAAANRRRR